MREIKFRGLTAFSGTIGSDRWVYGYAHRHHKHAWHIIPDGKVDFIRVIPVTIGQYTGLKDREGNEVWEGDIIKTKHQTWLVESINSMERDGNNYGLCVSPKGSGENYFIDKSILAGKIIGNIHENPELLEAEMRAENESEWAKGGPNA